jgi:hypothetical protein
MMGFDSFAAIDSPSFQLCHFTVPFHSTPDAGDGGEGAGSVVSATAGRTATGAGTALAAFDAAGLLDVGGVLPD